MGIFNWKKFPYTNFHELNLDYFINKFNEIFAEWENMYNTLNTWKDDTTTELEEWKTTTTTELEAWETDTLSDLNAWKYSTEVDISAWETATLSALNAWKTATETVFEQIRTEAAASATAAAGSATAATTAKIAAEAAQAVAEAAAASVTASDAQITTNTKDIAGLKSAVEYSVILDYGDMPYSAHLGSSGEDVYILENTIHANRTVKLKLNIYENCNFYIGFISKTTNKVLYASTVSLIEGINTIIIPWETSEDCRLIIDRGEDKILYTAGENITYGMTQNLVSYPEVNDIISATLNRTANFAISIFEYISSKELQNKIDNISDNVSDVSNELEILNTYEYKSMPFEYNENAVQVSSFLLNQPAKTDGVIKKINFKANSTYNVQITVFQWDGTTISVSAITPLSRYSVSVSDGIAYVNIPISKGQYIGVTAGTGHVCSWDSNTSGAGFVYRPEESANIAFYENKYITLSYEMYSSDSIKGMIDSKIESYTKFKIPNTLESSIIILTGDSRSSTDYTFYKSTLENKSGCKALNIGASGRNAAYNASNAYFSIIANNPHDFSLWLVGGNDTGESGTVGTFSASSPLAEMGEDVVMETDISDNYDGTTFIQAIDHIMRKYKYLYYDFKTLNNGHKPKMIFCTDLPQKRNNASSEYSKPENWERKRLAIIECCEKNNVACLDLLKLCNFDMSYEPYWTSPTDMVNDNGLYFMDGLHPNSYGCDIITSLEVQELYKYIMINPYPNS